MDFLSSLFKSLEISGLSYCVLRNYEDLPYSLNGSDLDILIPVHAKLFDIVRGAAEACGGKAIAQYRVLSFSRLCYIGKQMGVWWGVQCDIHCEETYKGIPYYDYKELLKRSNKMNGLYVCNDQDAHILALLKDSLSNGLLRKDYAERARQSYLTDPQYYRGQLSRYFGARIAGRWDIMFRSDIDPATFKKISKVSRYILVMHAFLTKPLTTMKRFLLYQKDRLSRIFKTAGFTVAFLGTDGSGKSTIIEGIRLPLESALHSKICYEHLRPNLLLPLSVIFGRPQQAGPVCEPHRSKPSGFAGSMLRLAYYSLDYILGYWFKVYPAIVKRPCLWVFDRYYYDYLYDPIRSRVSLPQWIIRIIGLVIPKPDLILCLGADVKTIYQRKPELPKDEIERQLAALREFCDKTTGTVWIDTGKSIKVSIDDALTAITTAMAARYTKVHSRGIL